MKYDMGDIVWVTNLQEEREVNNHLFVVISDDEQLIPADYFGFVVSSNTSKSKEVSRYKYNEPLRKSSTNNLDTDSIVKCDQLFKIPENSINCRIGTVEEEELNRFLMSYNDFLNELNV